MRVVGIQFSSSLVSIQGIANLVVARLIQGAKVVPNLRDKGVESDGPRVGIQGVAILVDLIVQDTNRTPEGGVPAIAIDGLLVGLVSLGVLLELHVATAEQVPALGIGLI